MPAELPGAARQTDLAMARALTPTGVELPRLRLTNLPTRVHRLPTISGEVGADVWIKRDDETATLYGGNKPRKLEFVLADALRQKKKAVITFGGIGTHHGLATAIFARSLGLRCILVMLDQPVTEGVRRSLLRDAAAGAEMYFAGGVLPIVLRSLRLCAEEWRHGNGFPYIIPTGGTSPLGALGYVNAAFELKAQIDAGELPEPAAIFLPVGSGGTMSGLVAGAKLAGLKSKIIGVVVTDILPPGGMRLAGQARRALAVLRRHFALPPATVRPADFTTVGGYVGAAYGAPTPAALAARERALAGEGLSLDTTYTAKCMAAMFDALAASEYRNRPVLFWNTYSSVDPDTHLGLLPDFHTLPPAFHRFFEGSP